LVFICWATRGERFDSFKRKEERGKRKESPETVGQKKRENVLGNSPLKRGSGSLDQKEGPSD